MATARTTEPGDTVTGYESHLWRMADALRGSIDAAEYKHVVLGLIFVKYISDAFEETYAQLETERDQGANPEDPDEYLAQNIFWVPAEVRRLDAAIGVNLKSLGFIANQEERR